MPCSFGSSNCCGYLGYTFSKTTVDCSNSLVVDPSFTSVKAPIPYNPSGSTLIITNGFTNIFTDSTDANCVLNTCTLREPGCGTALAS